MLKEIIAITNIRDLSCGKLGFGILTKPRPTNNERLILYKEYSREQLSSLFDPDISFTTH